MLVTRDQEVFFYSWPNGFTTDPTFTFPPYEPRILCDEIEVHGAYRVLTGPNGFVEQLCRDSRGTIRDGSRTFRVGHVVLEYDTPTEER